MSERWGHSRQDRESLDRHILGNSNDPGDDSLGDTLRELESLRESIEVATIKTLGQLILDMTGHVEHLGTLVALLAMSDPLTEEEAKNVGRTLEASRDVIRFAAEAGREAVRWSEPPDGE